MTFQIICNLNDNCQLTPNSLFSTPYNFEGYEIGVKNIVGDVAFWKSGDAYKSWVENNAHIAEKSKRDNVPSNMRHTTKKETIFLCCDICQISTVSFGDDFIRLPVLMPLRVSGVSGLDLKVDSPSWRKVIQPSCNQIDLYFTNIKGDRILFNSIDLTITLHLIKQP